MTMLRDLFKPTRALGKDYRLWRSVGGWTSNGFWVIRTSLEPRWMVRLKETSVAPNTIDKKIEEWTNLPKTRLEVDYWHVDISLDPTICLSSEDLVEYYLNAYYVSLVDSFKFKKQDILTSYFALGGPKDQTPIAVMGIGSINAFIAKVSR